MNKSPDTRQRPKKIPQMILRSPFRDWIDETGQVAAAKLIGCSDRALRAWLTGEYSPTIGFLEKIVKLSQGQLTKKIILDHVKAAALIRSTIH